MRDLKIKNENNFLLFIILNLRKLQIFSNKIPKKLIKDVSICFVTLYSLILFTIIY